MRRIPAPLGPVPGLAVLRCQGQYTGDKSVCVSRSIEIQEKSTQTRPLYAIGMNIALNKDDYL